MKIQVGKDTFAWGEHARDLPENSGAYGKKLLSPAQAKALVDAIAAAGWRPFWKKQVTHRVVFLVGPKWRQSVTAHGYEGNTLQVEERSP
jgi:hypothetical protein